MAVMQLYKIYVMTLAMTRMPACCIHVGYVAGAMLNGSHHYLLLTIMVHVVGSACAAYLLPGP